MKRNLLLVSLFFACVLIEAPYVSSAANPGYTFYSFPAIRFRAYASPDRSIGTRPIIEYIKQHEAKAVTLKTFNSGAEFIRQSLAEPATFVWAQAHVALFLINNGNYQPLIMNYLDNQTVILQRKITLKGTVSNSVASHDALSLPTIIARQNLPVKISNQYYPYQDKALYDLLAGKVQYAVVTRWASRLLTSDMRNKLAEQSVGPVFNGYVLLIHTSAENYQQLKSLVHDFPRSSAAKNAIELWGIADIKAVTALQLQRWAYLQSDIQRLLDAHSAVD